MTRPQKTYISWLPIAVFSVWLQGGIPLSAIGNAGHDDLLFIRHAVSILKGDWLGAYDNLTHAKGPIYSIWLALNHVLGTSLKLLEHLLFLTVSALFSARVQLIFNRNHLGIVVFTLLALSPQAWNFEYARVVREGLYTPLTVLLCYFCLAPLAPKQNPLINESYWCRQWHFKVGVFLGIYALTREEGLWIAPTLLLTSIFWWFTTSKEIRPTKAAKSILSVLLGIITVFCLFSAINWKYYDVFKTNDFRSKEFLSAYGALTRIKHDKPERLVVFPKDARQKAYEMSPSANELKAAFEGSIGESWRAAGCNQMQIDPCPEILAGWFMWALRDATASVGHYSSAPTAEAFYRKLALEINHACERTPSDCLPERNTLRPVIRSSDWIFFRQASIDITWKLIRMGEYPIGALASSGSSENLNTFQRITNQPQIFNTSILTSNGYMGIAPPEQRDKMRHLISLNIASMTVNINTFLSFFAIAALIAWIGTSIYIRQISLELMACGIIGSFIISRLGLLIILDATSIPANNMLYLSPITPFSLTAPILILLGSFRFFNKKLNP